MEFAQKTSKFILTMAFNTGFLSSGDATVVERCRKLEVAIAACDKIEKEINSKKAEIDLLISKIK